VFTTTFYLVVSVCIGWPLSIIQNMMNGERSWNGFKKMFFSSLFPFHYPNFDQWGR